MAASGQADTVKAMDQLVSLPTFYAVLWLGVALCVIAFAFRAYIRYVSFRHLRIEDTLMSVALVVLIATAIMCQLFLESIFKLMDVSNGLLAPWPTFLEDTETSLRVFGSAILLWYLGIWLIKFNFLIFFYRLGHQITSYYIFWWVVTIIVVGCGITEIAMLQFDCLFGDVMHIISTCSTTQSLERTSTVFKVSCILDVISDALIICFPISILWRISIDLRRKIFLSSIFLLVGLTIAVTIVRGSIFGGFYRSLDSQNQVAMNITWIWFWFSIEYVVSFLIACIVSFRTLFSQRRNQANIEAEAQMRRETAEVGGPVGFRARLKRLQDSLLDTGITLDSTESQQQTSKRPETGLPNISAAIS